MCVQLSLATDGKRRVLTEHNGAEGDDVTLSNTAISVIIGKAPQR